MSEDGEENKKNKPKPPEPDLKIEGCILNSISKPKKSNKTVKDTVKNLRVFEICVLINNYFIFFKLIIFWNKKLKTFIISGA